MIDKLEVLQLYCESKRTYEIFEGENGKTMGYFMVWFEEKGGGGGKEGGGALSNTLGGWSGNITMMIIYLIYLYLHGLVVAHETNN